MPRSRSWRAVSEVTQTWAGRLSGNRPRLTVWATPRTGNGRPWMVTVSPAPARRVAASPLSSTTPPPWPSQRPLVTNGWSTPEGRGSRTSAVRSSVPPAIRIDPYRWLQGPPAATTPGALVSSVARRRRAATRSWSPGSSGGWYTVKLTWKPLVTPQVRFQGPSALPYSNIATPSTPVAIVKVSRSSSASPGRRRRLRAARRTASPGQRISARLPARPSWRGAQRPRCRRRAGSGP